MSAPESEAQGPAGEALDLATLGKTWTAPQAADSTPEVSEILAEMPWWAARGLLYIVLAFVLAAVAWAHFSVLDVVSEARGTLVPEGHARRVASRTAGVVQSLLVREGDTVEAGQALVQLDAGEMRLRRESAQHALSGLEARPPRPAASGAAGQNALERRSTIARLRSEIASLDLALSQATLRSPVAGVVTSLNGLDPGAAVGAGDTVVTVAPAGARLVVEGQMPNARIAFVRPGLPAKLRFDAFPFEDYGVVPGTVVDVAPDARIDEELGSVYRITVVPDRPAIVAHGKEMPLRPGLEATIEVVTERRRILALFASPSSD